MSKSNFKDVRKQAIKVMKAPLNNKTLYNMAWRLVDQDSDVRKLTFMHLHSQKVTIEDFPTK